MRSSSTVALSAHLLLGGEHAKQVTTLLDGGVGLVALHWGTGVRSREETDLGRRYLSYLGGLFCTAYSGANTCESRVEQVAPTDPICNGWSGFELTDEYYLNLKFLPQAQPILKVSVAGARRRLPGSTNVRVALVAGRMATRWDIFTNSL